MSRADENRAPRLNPAAAAHLLLWNDRLSAFVDDALSEDESREVLAHLEVCDICRSRVQAYLSLRGVVSALPRRVAPGILSLRRQEAQRLARTPAPAIWAFSGAIAVLLILFVTRSLYLNQPGEREMTGEAALSYTAGDVKVTSQRTSGQEEIAGPEAGQDMVSEAEVAQEPPEEVFLATEGVAAPEKERRKDVATQRDEVRQMAADHGTPQRESQKEARPPEAEQPPPPAHLSVLEKTSGPEVVKPEPGANLLRITLFLPPEEANAERKGEESGSTVGMSAAERAAPALLATPAHTVSFVLPRKEWEALEEFLKKHYALKIEETAPAELRVTLTEAETIPESSQIKKEEKEHAEGKSRRKKMPLP